MTDDVEQQGRKKRHLTVLQGEDQPLSGNAAKKVFLRRKQTAYDSVKKLTDYEFVELDAFNPDASSAASLERAQSLIEKASERHARLQSVSSETTVENPPAGYASVARSVLEHVTHGQINTAGDLLKEGGGRLFRDGQEHFEHGKNRLIKGRDFVQKTWRQRMEASQASTALERVLVLHQGGLSDKSR